MKAKELRIGNLFIEKYTQQIIPVMEILRSEAIVFDFECNGVWQAEPIQITEEFLFKMGFTKEINYRIILDEFYHLELMKIGKEFSVFHEKRPEEEFAHSFRRIQFIHELQNIFFAITGTELTYENQS